MTCRSRLIAANRIRFSLWSFDRSKLFVYIFAIWVRQLLFVRQKKLAIELDRPMPGDRLPANGRLVTNFTADSLR